MMKICNYLTKSSSKVFTWLFLFVILSCAATSVFAQESEAARASNLTAINLPSNAVRLNDGSIPGEIKQALEKIVASGGADLRQGAAEVLAWTNGFKKRDAPVLIKQLTANLQAAGWQYETGGENQGVTVFAVMRTVPQKRAVVGFYTFSDDALIWAWTEMLAANSSQPREAKSDSIMTKFNQNSNDTQPSSSSEKIVAELKRDQAAVNVMGNQMPAMPDFPQLAPKPGKVRGYVKDWTGKPLQGAEIGVRASYFAGQYSGAQGKTDQNGYYEFVVPKGSAHFYNAGYSMNWGNGIAAVGLHPVDGSLDSFTTVDGAVENFVLLPYGVISREKLSANSDVSSTYYGGAIHVFYYAAEASDNRPMAGSIVENSIIEITLTPDGDLLDGSQGKTIVVRNPVGFRGNFSILNIPLGRYKITAKVGGKSLSIREDRKFNPLFGMSPEKTDGAASLLFKPSDAKASMVAPQTGAWENVTLTVTMP